jgi:uncharacterized protein (DUF1499 family)
MAFMTFFFTTSLSASHIDKKCSTKHNPSIRMAFPSQEISRRAAIIQAFSLVSGFTLSLPGLADESAAKGLRRGRLASCPSDVACLSTSASGSPDKYISPWTFPQGLLSKDAASQLIQYLERNEPIFTIVKYEYPYLAVEYNGGPVNGISDIEFLFREGDSGSPSSKETGFVTLRAVNRRSNQFYAFSGPNNNIKALLSDIRTSLGWNTIVDTDLFSR